jgi:hypothetical protein
MVQGTPSLIPIPFFISLFNTACLHSRLVMMIQYSFFFSFAVHGD